MSNGSTLHTARNSQRNIGIIAHIDAGKTTLTERILYFTNKIKRMGEVHEGAATMDFLPEEQERGITIASAACTCFWRNSAITVVDTPGHVDFGIEVERSLRVLDGAVGVFCAVRGVEPQSETVWKQANTFAVPRLVFINKMDRLGANFERTYKNITENLKVRLAPITIPIGEGESFDGVINLLSMKRMHFLPETNGMQFDEYELDKDEVSYANKWRDLLIEILSEYDDSILQFFLEGKTIPIELIKSCLRRCVLARKCAPVYSGSALRNAGIQPLLDGIVDFLPNPDEASLQIGYPVEMPDLSACAFDSSCNGEETIPTNEDISSEPITIDNSIAGPFAALVFKVIQRPSFLHLEKDEASSVNDLAFLRVYRGSIKVNEECYDASRKRSLTVLGMYVLDVDSFDECEVARSGDIVAVAFSYKVYTGASITSFEAPLLLESIPVLQPVISMAVAPKDPESQQKLEDALKHFSLEDPSFRSGYDQETGQILVSGMGELHLEVLLERLQREYKVQLRHGNPSVYKLQTISDSVSGSGRFNQMILDVPHNCSISLTLKPSDRGVGNSIGFGNGKNKLIAKNAKLLKEILYGLLNSGAIAIYPLTDIKIEIDDLECDGDFSEIACKMATNLGYRDALSKAKLLVLEPYMRMAIHTPDISFGSVLNLLQIHKGKVIATSAIYSMHSVEAIAPMQELFGFSTYLRSATKGRSSLQISFDHFDVV